MPCWKFEHNNCFVFILILLRSFVLFLVVFILVDQVKCLNFNYSSFPESSIQDFIGAGNSSIAILGALQVTTEVRGDPMFNFAGRILYKKRFRLWSKKKRKVECFNTTFVFRITPATNPAGEGLAFILTKDWGIPDRSYGQWLGIVNPTTNGSSSSSIVAVEFDTKKSYPEDLDNNHVGVNINSINSINQTSLEGLGLIISSATDMTAVISYNGTEKTLKVFLSYNNDTSGAKTKVPVIAMNDLDLSDYLPEAVYVGFSASTSDSTELNCVRSWSFTGGIDDNDSSVPNWVWVLVVSLSVGAFISVIAASYICWRKKKARVPDEEESESSIEDELKIAEIGPHKYQLKELRSATGNFHSKNELGRGGFGIVYKGILNGEEVAVKRLLENSQQGRKTMVAEVTTIGSLHHKNLVKLTGWCHEKNELLVVYDYMPNGSLDKHLYTQVGRISTSLSWERRHNIVCGVAQSLDYLHNECSKRILHRDIKASNIMLDSEFNACLGDFGLARMFKLSEKTHHTTLQIAGTPGYMAPEAFHTGKATAETDVYAFGVLALEVVCGRSPGTQNNQNGELITRIVDWVWELHGLDLICGAVDPKLKGDYDGDEAECVLLTGLACCHPNPYLRPSMRSALQVLMGELTPPRVPLEKPAFVWPASAPSLTREMEMEMDQSLSGGMLSSSSIFSGR